jgi:hypothetical protein
MSLRYTRKLYGAVPPLPPRAFMERLLIKRADSLTSTSGMPFDDVIKRQVTQLEVNIGTIYVGWGWVA